MVNPAIKINPTVLATALEGLLAPDAQAALTAAIGGLPLTGSGLIVLESETASFAALIAARAARPLGPLVDQRRFAPEGDRYTVAELDAILIAAALRPEQRNILTLEALDTAGELAIARLLRTVEEPPAPTLFIACVRDRARLGIPLLGRAHAIVPLTGPGDGALEATLITGGLARATARELLALCYPYPQLAVVLRDAHPEPLSMLRLLEVVATLSVDASTLEVTAAAEALEALTTRKDLRRDLLRCWLTRAAGRARELLATCDPDGLALVAAIDAATTLVDRYGSPAAVITLVTCRR